MLRKVLLAWMVNFAMKTAETGRMKHEHVIPFIAKASLSISTSLVYGNALLQYMSESEELAVLSAVSSIFTETAGKAYAVWATRKAMKRYLDAVVRSTSIKIGAAIIRAQAEPGLSGAANIGRQTSDSVSEQVAELMKKQVELLETIEEKDVALAGKERALAGKDMLMKLMREEIERLGGNIPDDEWDGGGWRRRQRVFSGRGSGRRGH